MPCTRRMVKIVSNFSSHSVKIRSTELFECQYATQPLHKFHYQQPPKPLPLCLTIMGHSENLILLDAAILPFIDEEIGANLYPKGDIFIPESATGPNGGKRKGP